MKSILSFLFICFLSLSFSQSKTMVDLEKSTLVWTGKKITGEHNGNIKLGKAYLSFEEGLLTGGFFAIDMNTITCTDLSGNMGDKLVSHLKDSDFFSTANFPEATLIFTEIKHIEGSSYIITANLTIKGITQAIEFSADLREHHGTALIKVDRTLYDIKYGSASFFDTLGDKAIEDIFELKVNLVY